MDRVDISLVYLNDDWVQLFINDECALQGHSLDPALLLEVLRDYNVLGSDNLRFFDVEAEQEDELSSYPPSAVTEWGD